MTVVTMRRADPTPALRAVDVSHALRDGPALDHVDLVVPAGGVTALVGPDGSGTTTLLHVFATLLAPDEGRVEVLGVDPADDPGGVRHLLGWAPAGAGPFGALTGHEALRTLAAAHGMRTASAATRVEALLADLGLVESARRRIRDLPDRERRRLGLAQALVHSPRVLVLDEPAHGMGPRDRAELHDTLRELANSGTTVLASTTALEDLDGVADHAAVMADGRVVARHDLHERPTLLVWRVEALDAERLHAVLRDVGTEFENVPSDAWVRRGAVDVGVADEADANALLRLLVAHDVPVVGFAPVDRSGRRGGPGTTRREWA